MEMMMMMREWVEGVRMVRGEDDFLVGVNAEDAGAGDLCGGLGAGHPAGRGLTVGG